MPKFEPGHPKKGGRKKGSKNIATIIRAEAVMAASGFNPTEFLISLALDSDIPAELRAKIGIELHNAINPKATASTVAPKEEPITVTHTADTNSLLKAVR